MIVFENVSSDMAPNFMGNSLTDHLRTIQLCESALKLAEHLLSPQGVFLAKLFGGSEEPRKFE
jgi:23S rRNA (uridine2552-2'-O)-methyltransferase